MDIEQIIDCVANGEIHVITQLTTEKKMEICSRLIMANAKLNKSELSRTELSEQLQIATDRIALADAELKENETGRDLLIKQNATLAAENEILQNNVDAHVHDTDNLIKHIETLEGDVQALAAENERLEDFEDFYFGAIGIMEGEQHKRALAGVEVGTTGSLQDGIAWLYMHIAKLEAVIKAAQEPVRDEESSYHHWTWNLPDPSAVFGNPSLAAKTAWMARAKLSAAHPVPAQSPVDVIEIAHMQGQVFAGVDPSFSAAKYYAKNSLHDRCPSHEPLHPIHAAYGVQDSGVVEE